MTGRDRDLTNRSQHVDDLSLKTGCCGRNKRKTNLREKRSRRKLKF